MRYQDWDVLVFPDESKIPLQEFKTTCQVIQDPEPHNLQLNAHLLPTVTSFIPGLPVGNHFRISIHSWRNPSGSRYTENLKKPGDTVVFEARLFIDGTLAGSKWFEATGPWPSIIELSIDLDKTGDFEKLKFPAFHKELLSQSHWSPADDLGRLKVVIAEGFARDTPGYPFERIKNIVSFSFQHAPLDVLEQSFIAWPNALMWRQASVVSPYYSQQLSPRRMDEPIELHGHSPRKAVSIFKQPFQPVIPFTTQGSASFLTRHGNADPFVDTRGPQFSRYRHMSSDVSMQDFSSSSSSSERTSVRNISDPMQLSDKGERNFQNLQTAGAYDQLIEALIPSAPVNTPQNGTTPVAMPSTRISSAKSDPIMRKSLNSDRSITNRSSAPAITPEKPENSMTARTQPSSNTIKSRKEGAINIYQDDADLTALINENINRIVSEATTPKTAVSTTTSVNITTSSTARVFSAGTKRPRVITPASTKVIDSEDDTRAGSPAMRKVSRGNTMVKAEGWEVERRVLGDIENV